MWCRQSPRQITELLKRVHEGDQQALRAVIPLVYNELKKLAAGHLRREARAQPIEMRYFGGMTAEESATMLSLSVHSVRRELRLAQAWLHKEMAE
jgi:hypothetical protein